MRLSSISLVKWATMATVTNFFIYGSFISGYTNRVISSTDYPFIN